MGVLEGEKTEAGTLVMLNHRVLLTKQKKREKKRKKILFTLQKCPATHLLSACSNNDKSPKTRVGQALS